MRVLIAAGGTAGHINPALAIAGAIKKADPSAVPGASRGKMSGTWESRMWGMSGEKRSGSSSGLILRW